jgi:antitoxin component of MazEF toxin-antitoxin module
MQATYHKKKIYVPKKIVETLHLEDGDRVDYVVRNENSVELRISRSSSGKDLLLQELKNPKPIGARVGSLRRRIIYEDSDRH